MRLNQKQESRQTERLASSLSEQAYVLASSERAKEARVWVTDKLHQLLVGLEVVVASLKCSSYVSIFCYFLKGTIKMSSCLGYAMNFRGVLSLIGKDRCVFVSLQVKMITMKVTRRKNQFAHTFALLLMNSRQMYVCIHPKVSNKK